MSERTATHRCKVCGALWILYPAQPDKYPPDHPCHGATWSLASKECGKCCDNVAMGDQIEALETPEQAYEAFLSSDPTSDGRT